MIFRLAHVKNPDTGIALRGPLSQFFSALYLKPLDDAFNEMDVACFRYQDDILVPKHAAVNSFSCRDEQVAAYAAGLLHRHDVNSVKSETLGDDYLASSGLQVVI